jgi:hypothetical protein
VKIKYVINVFLALLILVSNIGLSLNVHYCEDKISGISFNYKGEEPCFEVKAKSTKSCCAIENDHAACCTNDKVELKKTTSDNILIKNFELDLSSFIPVQECSFLNTKQLKEVVLTSENSSFYCESNAPPKYKLYSQFIFYA